MKNCNIKVFCVISGMFLASAFQGLVFSDAPILCSTEQINTLNPSGYAPLHLAVQAGQTQEVRLLLKQGAFVDVQDYSHCTPLWWAAERGYADIAKILLEAGARFPDHIMKSVDLECPLQLAASKGNGAFVLLLLRANDHTNHFRELVARALYAVIQNMKDEVCLYPQKRSDYLEISRALLEAGVSVGVCRGALGFASDEDLSDVVEILEKFEKQKEKKIHAPSLVGPTATKSNIIESLPSLKAVESGDLAALKSMPAEQLFMHDFATGDTPLRLAFRNGNLAIQKYLIDRGALQAAFKDLYRLASVIADLVTSAFMISGAAPEMCKKCDDGIEKIGGLENFSHTLFSFWQDAFCIPESYKTGCWLLQTHMKILTDGITECSAEAKRIRTLPDFDFYNAAIEIPKNLPQCCGGRDIVNGANNGMAYNHGDYEKLSMRRCLLDILGTQNLGCIATSEQEISLNDVLDIFEKINRYLKNEGWLPPILCDRGEARCCVGV